MEAYRKIKTLGKGAFGEALLVENKSTKEICCIKQVNMIKLPPKEKREARKECELLRHMRHPNIVSFIDSFETRGMLYIVMDFADGGDLSTAIEKRHGTLFPEQQVIDYFVQICLAVKHCHDRKVLHRDLKTQNIFLTSKGMVKLGDFGIAKELQKTSDLARTQIGTPYYLSPEICNGRSYNNKSDVWALGVVLYEMSTLKHPFEGRNIEQLVVNISKGRYKPLSSKYSNQLHTLVKQLLSSNQRLRPNVQKIFEMKVIQNRISTFLSETIFADEFSHTVLHGGKLGDKRKMTDKNNEAKSIASETPEAVVDCVVAETRGICGGCSKLVKTDEDRTKDNHGVYWHVACIKTRQLESIDMPKSGAPPARHKPEPMQLPPIVPDYKENHRINHRDFLARRKQRQDNKLRVDMERKAPAYDLPVRDSRAPGRGVSGVRSEAPKHTDVSASAGGGKQKEEEETRLERVREFNERQRQAREYRERAKDNVMDRYVEGTKKKVDDCVEEMHKPVVAVIDAKPIASKQPTRQPSAPKSSKVGVESSKTDAESSKVDAESSRVDAESVLDDLGRTVTIIEKKKKKISVDAQTFAVPKSIPKVTSSPHRREAIREMKKRQKALLKEQGKRIDFVFAEEKPAQPDPVVNELKNAISQMLDEQLFDVDEDPLVVKQSDADEYESLSPVDKMKFPPTREPSSVNVVSEHKSDGSPARKQWGAAKQVLAIISDSNGDADVHVDVNVDVDGDSVDDVDGDGGDGVHDDDDSNKNRADLPDEKSISAVINTHTDANEKEDNEYVEFLAQLSMVSNDDFVAAQQSLADDNEATITDRNNVADDNNVNNDNNNNDMRSENWLNGSDGGGIVAEELEKDFDFGDDEQKEEEDNTATSESIFAEMERRKLTLENNLGFDLFFEVYKTLRDVFGSELPVSEVPLDIQTTVLEKLGPAKLHHYDEIVRMTKLENGIFI